MSDSAPAPANRKRILTRSASSGSSPNKRIKTSSTYKLPSCTYGLFLAPVHTSAAGLYKASVDESPAFDESSLTDFTCTFLVDLPGVAKAGDVASSIHHNFDYGTMDVTIRDKIYTLKMGHFFYGSIQAKDLNSKAWDGSIASLD